MSQIETRAAPSPVSPVARIDFIGWQVFLPYAHMSKCREVFQYQSRPAVSLENWTIETVVKLVKFRPQNRCGVEITSYQEKQVPEFIQDLREADPEMWEKLIAVFPAFEGEIDFVGRKAFLKTLASPISIPPQNPLRPVAWEWDGETLVTRSRHAYDAVCAGVDSEDVTIAVTPDDQATVVVAANFWVTPDTKFVD